MRGEHGRYVRNEGFGDFMRGLTFTKLLVLGLVVLLIMPHVAKLKNFFNDVSDATSCKSNETVEQIVFSTLDQAYARKTSPIGFDWMEKYNKATVKKREKTKQKEAILIAKMQRDAKKDAYGLIKKDIAEKLKDKLISETPGLATPSGQAQGQGQPNTKSSNLTDEKSQQ